MKKIVLTACIAAITFTACGDDDSSVTSPKSNTPYCNVKKSGSEVIQEVYGPSEGFIETSVRLKKGNAVVISLKHSFENLSKAEISDFCESYENMSSVFDDGSFTCNSKGASYVWTDESNYADIDEIFQSMKDGCKVYEEKWDEESLEKESSSSSVKRSSSSSAESSSSSSVNKTSSSSVKSSSSSEKNSSSSAKSSSSVEEPESSSEDVESSSSKSSYLHRIHGEPFDGMSVASEPLVRDDNTLYFDDFDGGVLCLYKGDYYRTGFSLNEDMPEGKLEFFFRPHDDFFDEARVLVGNDGARLLVFYDGVNLVLMMNKTNSYRYIKEPVEINKDDWNFVKVVWEDDMAFLFLNNAKVGETNVIGGYETSNRSGEQELVFGEKSSCCMSGAGQNSAMGTSADFGPIKISVLR